MIQAPIFHVNGDDPEACVRVARAGLRVPPGVQQGRRHRPGLLPPPRPQRGRRPVVHPAADVRPDRRQALVRKLYTEALIGRGDITVEEAEAGAAGLPGPARAGLHRDPAAAKAPRPARTTWRSAAAVWSVPARRRATWPRRRARCDRRTGRGPEADRRRVRLAAGGLHRPPAARRSCSDRRREMIHDGAIDWAMGELLAFGSLLLEGTPVRLAGQDTRRGTFGQRHAVLDRPETAEEYTPLLYLSDDQARFYVYDSLLSRVRRDGLRVRLLGGAARTRWCCGRRSSATSPTARRRIIDEFISLGEQKWGQHSARRPAAAARLRGPGPGPLVGPDRALPADVRRGQHDGRDAVHARVVLPPAAPAGFAQPASPLIVFTPKSMLRLKAAATRSRTSRPGRSSRCIADPSVTDPAPDRPGAAVQRQGLLRPGRRAGQDRRHPHRDRPGRAALPAAARRDRGRGRASSRTPSWSGPRRSRPTRARGRSSR